MLGNNVFVSHLLKTLHAARTKGLQIISIIYGYAWGASILAMGLSADRAYSLRSSNIGEMTIEAMSKVTLLSIEKLIELSKTNATFAPGAENFLKLGGIEEIWEDKDVCVKLRQALKNYENFDNRSLLGLKRRGRILSYKVNRDVINGKKIYK